MVASHPTNQAVFPATIEQVPVICEWITTAAREEGMAEANLWKLETAVDEACTNICCYSYLENQSGNIELNWEVNHDDFIVTIQDRGVAFDQTKPTNPDLDCDICQRKVGGLGRHIMRSFVDGMHYRRQDDRNVLILTKSLYEEKKAAVS